MGHTRYQGSSAAQSMALLGCQPPYPVLSEGGLAQAASIRRPNLRAGHARECIWDPDRSQDHAITTIKGPLYPHVPVCGHGTTGGHPSTDGACLGGESPTWKGVAEDVHGVFRLKPHAAGWERLRILFFAQRRLLTCLLWTPLSVVPLGPQPASFAGRAGVGARAAPRAWLARLGPPVAFGGLAGSAVGGPHRAPWLAAQGA